MCLHGSLNNYRSGRIPFCLSFAVEVRKKSVKILPRDTNLFPHLAYLPFEFGDKLLSE